MVNNTDHGFDDPTSIASLLSSGAITTDQYNHHLSEGNLTLGAIRRATAEEVLEYIESVLNLGSLVLDVEFKVSDTDGTGSIGAADAGMLIDGGFYKSYAYKHIEDGVDPDATRPDMRVYVDFGYDDINDVLNSDYSIVDPARADLFTVLLHEFTHDLGVASKMLISDNPAVYNTNGTYSLWDHLLYYQGMSGTFFKAINSSGMSPWAEVSAKGSVFFKSTSLNEYFPVTSNIPAELGTSYSHIDVFQRGSYNVMSPEGTAGSVNREWNDVEILILCELGYQLKGNATTPPYGCVAPPFGKRDDVVYTATKWQSIDVLNNDIDPSSNGLTYDADFNTVGYSIYNNVYVGDFRWKNNKLEYLPDPDFCGPVTVSYVPKDAVTGRVGIETFVYINVECTFCPDNPCSLICNGDFENGIPFDFFERLQGDYDFVGVIPPEPSIVDFWWQVNSTVDLFIEGSSRLNRAVGQDGHPSTYNSSPSNNRYMGGFSYPSHGEHFATQTMELNISNDYQLDFKAHVVDVFPNTPAPNKYQEIRIGVGPNFHEFGSLTEFNTLVSQGKITHEETFQIDEVDFDGWQDLSTTISGYSGKQFVYFIGTANVPQRTYVHYDAVSLTEIGPKLSVVVTPDKENPEIGETVEFTIEITNSGTVDAINVNLENIMSADLEYVDGDFSYAVHPLLAHFISIIKIGNTETLKFRGKVKPSATPCDPIFNVFEIKQASPSIGCFRTEYKTQVMVYDECICDQICDDCIEVSEGHRKYQKKYFHDDDNLIPRSTKIYKDRTYVVSEVVGKNEISVSVFRSKGSLLINSFTYKSEDRPITAKDLIVNEKGIYLIGNQGESASQEHKFLISTADREFTGYIARFDLDGNFMWAQNEMSSTCQYNAFSPTYDGNNSLNGFLVVGGEYRTDCDRPQAMLIKMDTNGNNVFKNIISDNGSCQNGTFAFDIASPIEGKAPYHKVLVNWYVLGTGSPVASQYSYLEVDDNGTLVNTSLKYQSSAGSVFANKILQSYDKTAAEERTIVMGTGLGVSGSFLTVFGASQNVLFEHQTNMKVHDALVLSDGNLLLSSGYGRDLMELTLDGTKMHDGWRSIYTFGTQTSDALHYLDDIGERTNRGNTLLELSNEDRVCLGVYNGGLVFSSFDDTLRTTCAVEQQLNTVTNTTSTSSANNSSFTPSTSQKQVTELCQNRLPLEVMCCDSVQLTPTTECIFSFSFDVDITGNVINLVGLGAVFPNSRIKITGATNGVLFDELIGSSLEYTLPPDQDKYTICVTQIDADSCEFTYCVCTDVGCPDLETETLTLYSCGECKWYIPDGEDEYDGYTLIGISGPNNDQYNYNSDIGGTHSNGQHYDGWIAHCLKAGGIYQIDFYYRDSDGNLTCHARSLTITVLDGITACPEDVYFYVCQNEATVIGTPVTSPNSYRWLDGGGHGAVRTVTPSFSGVYYLEITNEFGCACTTAYHITLIEDVVLQLQDDTICLGEEYCTEFTDFPFEILNYTTAAEFDFGDGTQRTYDLTAPNAAWPDPRQCHVYDLPGTYTVTATYHTTCGTVTATSTVVVKDWTIISCGGTTISSGYFDATMPEIINLEYYFQLHIDDFPCCPGLEENGVWYDNMGNVIPDPLQASKYLLLNGGVTKEYISDSEECVKCVYSLRATTGEEPPAQTTNDNNTMYLGDLTQETITLDQVVGDGKSGDELIQCDVSPNPFKNNLEVSYYLESEKTVHICLTDMLGRCIVEVNPGMKVAGEHKTTIDTRSISAGVYYFEFKVDGEVFEKKMIKVN
ncbi:MAG: T9SS type A sorting domain-containing protein [Bacteroidia bacterium]|nr:T9SS type A sorting domain-containing protein [Bacteroidia bacterium]